MKKNNKSTTRKKVTTVKRTPLKQFDDEYLDMFTFKRHPIHREYIEHLAQELVRFVHEQEDVLHLSDYYVAKGITKTDWERWKCNYPFFKTAVEHAKTILSARRERGALYNKLNPSVVLRMQAMYDADYKSLEEWRAKMRQQVQGDTNIEVVIPPIVSEE